MSYSLKATLPRELSDRVWKEILREAEENGLTRSTLRRSLIRIIVLSFLLGTLLYFGWTTTSYSAFFVLSLGISLLLSQFAFLGHDAGHASISPRSAINRALGQYSMTFTAGMCFDAWYRTHRTHHQYCQMPDRDPDMQVNLVASLSEESLASKSKLGHDLTRFQHWHIWLLAFLFAFSQRHLTQWDAIRWRCGLDGIATIFHLALWFALPCFLLDVSFGRALALYCLPLLFLGPHLAAIFWVNHIGMPKVEDPANFSFLEHQALTSRTVEVPVGFRWLFGGLDCQIEHHLYPKVPSHRLRKLQVLVRRTFGLRNIPYAASHWLDAIASVAGHFRNIAKIAASRRSSC